MHKLILSNIGINILSLGVQFFLLIFTNRILEPEGRGIVSSLLSWNSLYFTIGYLSLHIAIVNLLPKNPQEIPHFVGSSILTSLILGALGFIIAFFLFYISPNWYGDLPFELYVLMIAIIPIMMLQGSFLSILQMSGNLNFYNIHGLIYVLFQLVLTGVFLVSDTYNIHSAIYIIIINYLFSMLVSYSFIRKNHKRVVFDIRHSLNMIKVGTKAHIASVATFFASNVDILMINSMLGKTEAGIYFLAVMLGRILLIIPRSVQTIFYHHVSTDKKENIQEDLFRATRITVFFMVVGGIVLALFAHLLVYILGGEEFYEATYVLWVLLPGFAFLSVPMVLATIWNSMGIFKYLNIFTTIMIVLVILLNYVFIPIWGMYGAALGTVLTYVYLCIVHLMFVRKFLNEKNILKVILISREDLVLIKTTFRDKLLKKKKV